MDTIKWEEFTSVEMRVGRIVDVQDFEESDKPSYRLWADFGAGYGIMKSSAQITDLYNKDDLIGTEIIGVLNIPPKQVGPFISEFLVTGFTNKEGQVVLAVPERPIEPGLRLH